LYRSFLLRLWTRTEEGTGGTWYASLESPLTQEQRHFADLESLFTFLRRVTAPAPPADQHPAPPFGAGTEWPDPDRTGRVRTAGSPSGDH
jgi:hypothetical protein